MMHSKSNSKKDSTDQDLESWLLPFADMVTFLMAFFVILYTTASIDEQHANKIKDSIAETLTGNVTQTPKQETKATDYQQLLEKINQSLSVKQLGNKIVVERTFTGLKIVADSKLLFSSGSNELTMKARIVLVELASLFKELKVNISVEGHTDDVPINTARFPSNWELSTARAISVIHLFADRGISDDRMNVLGFADTRPVTPITDDLTNIEAARATNRRVVILLSER